MPCFDADARDLVGGGFRAGGGLLEALADIGRATTQEASLVKESARLRSLALFGCGLRLSRRLEVRGFPEELAVRLINAPEPEVEEPPLRLLGLEGRARVRALQGILVRERAAGDLDVPHLLAGLAELPGLLDRLVHLFLRHAGEEGPEPRLFAGSDAALRGGARAELPQALGEADDLFRERVDL